MSYVGIGRKEVKNIFSFNIIISGVAATLAFYVSPHLFPYLRVPEIEALRVFIAGSIGYVIGEFISLK